MMQKWAQRVPAEKPSELRLDESGWHKIAEAIETAT
jgi:hypothetical protein